jgi:hypothetical protein
VSDSNTLHGYAPRPGSNPSTDLEQRYKKAVREFCLGALGQVGVRHQSMVIDVDQYMDFRRGSIGTYPSFALVEYAVLQFSIANSFS